jgi:site-specific DNA-cytosine methylase
MRVLELFKGSGSITNYYKDRDDVEVISLDFDPKYKPDICCDIMNWDYKTYDKNHFDIIWASPDCRLYSTLQYTHIGRKWDNKEHLIEEQKKNIKYMIKTIEIIEYLKPTYYYIENPNKSMIWNYIIDYDISKKFIVVDYCKFSYSYRKRTKILTNKKLDNIICNKKSHEINMGMYKKGQADYPKSLLERYSIPQKLLTYLLE